MVGDRPHRIARDFIIAAAMDRCASVKDVAAVLGVSESMVKHVYSAHMADPERLPAEYRGAFDRSKCKPRSKDEVKEAWTNRRQQRRLENKAAWAEAQAQKVLARQAAVLAGKV